MSDTDCVEVAWRKATSSYSNGACVEVGVMRKATASVANGACVEAGPCTCGDDILIRDSKDPGGPRLRFGPQAWAEFTRAIKAGELH